MTPSSARGGYGTLRRRLFPALTAALAVASSAPSAAPEPLRPTYDATGALRRPPGIDRWIMVGASLGLGYSDATEDGPGRFHRVYLEPGAYDHYRRTGAFPDGTMLALTIRHPARRVPPSRAGWTEGDLVAVEMAVKDRSRFPGSWAYFDFGTSATVARAIAPERCANCHAEHAARDHVFVQFYPQLRER